VLAETQFTGRVGFERVLIRDSVSFCASTLIAQQLGKTELEVLARAASFNLLVHLTRWQQAPQHAFKESFRLKELDIAGV
jgi:hypothetical protein